LIYAADSVASNRRQRRRTPGPQRLALLVFGAVLVLLFVGFAIAEGIGNPNVPSGDVAVIEDVPDDLGTITEGDLDHAIEQAASSAGAKSTPKPGDKQYDELKETALGELLDRVWIQGQAEEMGIAATPKEVSEKLEKLKKQEFKSEAQYNEVVKEAHFTEADVNERVKVQIFTEAIQKQISEVSSTPSSGEIEDYYEAAKSSQYTKPETRDVRLLVFKTKSEAETAKAQLEKDDSAGSWKRLAGKSSGAVAKKSGGLQKGVTDGQLPEPLNRAIFAAPTGQVEGLVKGPGGYTVFEVEKVEPEKIQSLEEVKSQISSQLGEQAQQQALARFIRNYGSTWKSRTFCVADFTIERCSNYKGDGHPAEADPACYEEDPKVGLPEDCPAPVAQIKPALPGSVDVLTPEGEKLAQRPTPSNAEATTEAGGLTGAPPVVPGE
jgi:parvulin-like peptidyl-prolyl isomerase